MNLKLKTHWAMTAGLALASIFASNSALAALGSDAYEDDCEFVLQLNLANGKRLEKGLITTGTGSTRVIARTRALLKAMKVRDTWILGTDPYVKSWLNKLPKARYSGSVWLKPLNGTISCGSTMLPVKKLEWLVPIK